MNARKTALAAAIVAAIGAGFAGQAAAGIYGGASLDIAALSITVVNSEGAAIIPDAFNFSLSNSADLDTFSGSPTTTSGGGAGTRTSAQGVLPPTYSTNPGGLSTAVPTIDPAPANDPGNTVNYTNNAFTLSGPGTQQYSSADNVLWTAELVNYPTPTHAQLQEESELQTGNGQVASSNSNIQSGVSYSFDFTVASSATMTISFDATSYLRSTINDPLFISGNSETDMNVSAKLTQNGVSTNNIEYTPNGNLASGCAPAQTGDTWAGTCVETLDPFSLNTSTTASANGANDQQNHGPGSFLVTITIPVEGTYSFTLAANAISTVSYFRGSTPEPATLLLLGSGIAGLGISAKKRRPRRRAAAS
jgi:hypothetical protein